MRDLKNNPFMILGVSSDAEMREIKQVAQRLLMEHRLGGEADPAAVRRIDGALETLQDPVQRMQWGLFWPELTDGEADRFRADPVLSTLASDPRQDGAAAYAKIAESDAADVRSHNLGVLALLRAVAATEHAQEETPDDIEDDLECARLWQVAYRHLLLPISSDTFWMRQRLRAKGLGDARLNSDRLEAIRAAYPSDILSPAADVIRKALLAGHSKVARVYVKLLRTSGFDGDFIEQTLSGVYKPLADRIERNVQQLMDRLAEVSTHADDEREFAYVLDAFKKSALRDLCVMLDVGDLPGYAEEHARDTAADFLRSLSIGCWNKSGEAAVAKEAGQIASRIADSTSLKSKIAEDLSTLVHLETQKEVSQRLEPLWDAFQQAWEAGRLKVALSALDDLITAAPEHDQAKLKAIRSNVSTAVATDLFNQAVKRANARDFVSARTLLQDALFYETDPLERRLINEVLAKIPQAATGCLTSLILVVASTTLAGAAGGMLYATLI